MTGNGLGYWNTYKEHGVHSAIREASWRLWYPGLKIMKSTKPKNLFYWVVHGNKQFIK